ncbi:16S rRNA (adenine(1518)-N(6)/adenine(1519)-N(6))-dimethyltransferase RsmA [Gluconobacter wancherniae]|uniref:16S rRNA (adenine(1518)-N(6)/adenine(1519)-N(6))- dimethyltransferase RsmA n=1 Tax=Gluconobacter wancherniae TaxID=1307955 RepID=UPI001B8AB54B|nr:16S rRNA (adenine(1518)-N(6)/adenine(1519)-N(6))-dimethyltransferase RsmA [Gluconobacter wancherniae]MBS1089145.1 16S rRNA (adenine(1518)-N(6)/adenine(1519)-N(6))-dimethyltransferase RsmA [Gluconobacter wancherniae]MBS1094313.1 16S rRNA (adenine(1518)-N(6)/adenine(1519)-N(6))-dimethyltransferase RsmA [Gluconobacter wancherniae]MBS1094598.1 16S rRNA (adenine(1518)-N(6)/adenine(1519)-N(6))-dimethyltransferase RsmA [Gluconobacter wancherniae]
MNLPSLRDTIHAHGLDAKKSLGQHFLLDPGICARIASLGGDLTGRSVVEIGPGPGGLTRALLDSPASRVDVVEIDSRAWPLLEELASFYPERLHIVQQDALKLDAASLGPAPRQIIANLPYNVATPLLVGWLRQADQWERMALMFQLEVAERICAEPDSSAYGRLAVLAQWCASCSVVLRIPPGAFSPPPKVNSAIALLIPHKQQPSPDLFRAMEQVTAAAFGQRRKMLRSSLKPIGGEALLEKAGILATRRAETLTVEEFNRLAELHLANKKKA